jgi:predicted protein tyrosine phosphatase
MSSDAVIIIRPRHHVETGLCQGAALVSIAGHNGPSPRLGDRWPHRHDLRFDDVPAPKIMMIDGLWRGPTEADLQAAIDFARMAPRPLIVHCEQGKSRSAGIALAVLADQLGPGQEGEAVRQMMAAALEESRAQPNPLLVTMADRLLGREGHIWAALMAGCPSFASWVKYWQRLGAWPRDEEVDS